jgi:hypothetical protein
MELTAPNTPPEVMDKNNAVSLAKGRVAKGGCTSEEAANVASDQGFAGVIYPIL